MPNLESGFTLRELDSRATTFRKPAVLLIGDDRYRVGSWVDFTMRIVSWLIRNGHIHASDLPVFNYTGRNKYFMNTKPRHEQLHDAIWKEVEGMYVDVKYNSWAHIKNVIFLLDHLGLNDLRLRVQLKD